MIIHEARRQDQDTAVHVLNVTAVSVGTSGGAVECTIVEDEPAAGLTEKQCLSFGFRRESDAESSQPASDRQAVSASLVVVDAEFGTWHKSLTLPFPPFAGLCVQLDADADASASTVVSVFSVVLGDRHGPVSCLPPSTRPVDRVRRRPARPWASKKACIPSACRFPHTP